MQRGRPREGQIPERGVVEVFVTGEFGEETDQTTPSWRVEVDVPIFLGQYLALSATERNCFYGVQDDAVRQKSSGLGRMGFGEEPFDRDAGVNDQLQRSRSSRRRVTLSV